MDKEKGWKRGSVLSLAWSLEAVDNAPSPVSVFGESLKCVPFKQAQPHHHKTGITFKRNRKVSAASLKRRWQKQLAGVLSPLLSHHACPSSSIHRLLDQRRLLLHGTPSPSPIPPSRSGIVSLVYFPICNHTPYSNSRDLLDVLLQTFPSFPFSLSSHPSMLLQVCILVLLTITLFILLLLRLCFGTISIPAIWARYEKKAKLEDAYARAYRRREDTLYHRDWAKVRRRE